MKTNAASVSLKDGRGQQMIQIDQHGQKENEIHSFPLLAKEQPGNERRKCQV